MAKKTRQPSVGSLFLTIAFLLFIAVPIVIYSINEMVTNAPLQLGDELITDTATYEPGDSIPYGTTPRELLLITDQAGDWDVAVLQTDGSILNLTADDSGAEDLMPVWSFDGNTINFVTNRRDPEELGPAMVKQSTGEIQLLSVIGGALTMFREGQFDWDPTWSPDASQLVWVSVRNLNLELYQIATDAGFEVENATRLTSGNGRSWYPAWSPDGSRLLFNNNGSGNEEIVLLDVATNEQTVLTENENDDIRGLWSLDGETIAFASERRASFAEGGLDLFIMNADGSNPRPMPEDYVFEGGAVWAPGGSHVAYLSNAEGNWNIYVMNADGSNLRRVTDNDANYLIPVWKP